MIFKIEWPTGHMELDVGGFFGTASKKRIGKALRLAKQYCNEDDRIELIRMLNEEIKTRTAALDACGDADWARRQALKPFFGDLMPMFGKYEKALTTQRDRLRMCYALVEKARWANATTSFD